MFLIVIELKSLDSKLLTIYNCINKGHIASASLNKKILRVIYRKYIKSQKARIDIYIEVTVSTCSIVNHKFVSVALVGDFSINQ